MKRYLLTQPDAAESKRALSLVQDAGGDILQVLGIGIIVQCQRWVANQLDLIEIVNTQTLEV